MNKGGQQEKQASDICHGSVTVLNRVEGCGPILGQKYDQEPGNMPSQM
jgi:hypothetical protein